MRSEKYKASRRKKNMAPEKWRRVLAMNDKARKANPNRYKWFRKHDLKRYYGMTLEDWEALFNSQGRCCAVCRSSHSGRKTGQWCTDHDHVSEKVRGILCNGCNAALGHTKDDPLRLRLLAEYVEKGTDPNARD